MAEFVVSEKEKHTITGFTGTATVYFNSTDYFFLERVLSVLKSIAEKDDEWKRKLAECPEEKSFSLFREFNDEASKAIDELFESPVCDIAFHDCFIFQLVFSGPHKPEDKPDTPIWLAIIMWVYDLFYEAGTSAENLTMKRIRKYSEKYKKK